LVENLLCHGLPHDLAQRVECPTNIQGGKLNQLRAEQQRMFQNLTWKDLVEKGFVIAGSPRTVRERCEHMIKSLRVGHVFGLFHIGNMPDEKTRYSTKLFAERVMPALHGLWPEWKDDRRWWIKPYEKRVRPAASAPSARSEPKASEARAGR